MKTVGNSFGINFKVSDNSYLFNTRSHFSKAIPDQPLTHTHKKSLLRREQKIGWVFVSNTPRRVTRLPSDAVGKTGENIYLTADYTITTGFDLTPEAFAGTTFAGQSAGTRGWWRGVETDQEGSYSLGKLTHDDLEIANLRAVTDTRVYVARNTLTNLAKDSLRID